MSLSLDVFNMLTKESILLSYEILAKSFLLMPGKILLSVLKSVILESDVLASTSRLYFLRKELGKFLAGMFAMLIFNCDISLVETELIIAESEVDNRRLEIVSADRELIIFIIEY